MVNLTKLRDDLRRERDLKVREVYRTFECHHELLTVVRAPVQGGGVQYVRQCDLCGEKVGSPISQRDRRAEFGEPPMFDAGIREAHRAARDGAVQAVHDWHSAAWGEQVARYHAYLGSDAWRSMRERALVRAGGVCEGCLSATATEVHHLTYTHVGNELAFQLVAVCDACHKVCHGDDNVGEV